MSTRERTSVKLYRCTAGHLTSDPQPKPGAVDDRKGPFHCPYPCMADTVEDGIWKRALRKIGEGR